METTELKEKSFEELMSEASSITDARKKVFNELTASIKKVLIPSLVKVMNGYGLKKVYICTDNRPIKGFEGYPDPHTEETEYGTCINENGTICEAAYDYMRDKWGHEEDDINEYEVLRSGAINLATSILLKIEWLNSVYSQKNMDAKNLIDRINCK